MNLRFSTVYLVTQFGSTTDILQMEQFFVVERCECYRMFFIPGFLSMSQQSTPSDVTPQCKRSISWLRGTELLGNL